MAGAAFVEYHMSNTLPTEARTGLPVDRDTRLRVAGTLIASCLTAALTTAAFGLAPNFQGVFAARLSVSGQQLTWIGDAMFVGAVVAA